MIIISKKEYSRYVGTNIILISNLILNSIIIYEYVTAFGMINKAPSFSFITDKDCETLLQNDYIVYAQRRENWRSKGGAL